MDKRTIERTNGQTDGQTVRFYYAQNFIWEHKNQILYGILIYQYLLKIQTSWT